MKRILLTFAFALFLINLNFAQSKHRVGVLGGINHYSLRGSDAVDAAEPNYGSVIGLSYQYKFNQNFSFVTGITSEKKELITPRKQALNIMMIMDFW
ncbi:hypothetical protein J2X31_001781 [Flavobacterium arsenatis]|uniref:Outer membrane protein beta-barrel domain-containing protein n=1 Tax=Flavobacterium arsenatis TaxID=1484332 RepID=A0ABU1TP97_9FLAO|nr:hypothetical protein [Flavobacterium arsenatis]MDR6967769.1 hypothetical protein [Flavobacterium arsenatis]